MPELQLTPYYCYETRPQNQENLTRPWQNGLNGGFFGELAEMVRHNMTIEQALAHHLRTWGFEGGFNDIATTTHEIAHQILMHACIYASELQFLLPQQNPDTGKMRPTGYNGFTNGEGIVHHIENFLDYNKYDFPSLETNLIKFRESCMSYFKKPTLIDRGFWTSIMKNASSDDFLFKEKFSRNFSFVELNSPSYDQMMESPETHPDIIEDMKEIPLNIITPLQRILEKFAHHYFEEKPHGLKTTYNEDNFLKIKVRDLHKLIGGEEAAAEFFQYADNRAHAMGLNPVP